MAITDKAKKDLDVKVEDEIVEEELAVEEEPLQESKKVIKHIIRGLSPTGVGNEEAGTFPVEEVEQYINMYLDAGFELVHVEHLERVKGQDGSVFGELMLYVLVGEVSVN